MSHQQVMEILHQAISRRDAEHMIITADNSANTAIRFANSQPTQNQATSNTRVNITVAYGQRVGRSQCNSLMLDDIQTAINRAEHIAQIAPANLEYTPPVDIPLMTNELLGRPLENEEAISALGLQVSQCLHVANDAHSQAAGLAEWCSGEYCMATSTGQSVYQHYGSASLKCAISSVHGSGYAEGSADSLTGINSEAVAQQAAHDARELPLVELDPGEYPLLMMPLALEEFLGYLSYFMDARAADENRSCFSNKQDEMVAHPDFSLLSRPMHPAAPGYRFDNEGNALDDVDWISNGQLRSLSTNRFWAAKSGRTFTGRPSNLLIPGTDRTVEQMVSKIDRGLLASRFWYIRHVDPMRLTLTGMTRDGFFLVENGQVVARVKQMRFNESPFAVLPCITDIGTAVRVGSHWLLPPVTVEGFHFTSRTTF